MSNMIRIYHRSELIAWYIFVTLLCHQSWNSSVEGWTAPSSSSWRPLPTSCRILRHLQPNQVPWYWMVAGGEIKPNLMLYPKKSGTHEWDTWWSMKFQEWAQWQRFIAGGYSPDLFTNCIPWYTHHMYCSCPIFWYPIWIPRLYNITIKETFIKHGLLEIADFVQWFS